MSCKKKYPFEKMLVAVPLNLSQQAFGNSGPFELHAHSCNLDIQLFECHAKNAISARFSHAAAHIGLYNRRRSLQPYIGPYDQSWQGWCRAPPKQWPEVAPLWAARRWIGADKAQWEGEKRTLSCLQSLAEPQQGSREQATNIQQHQDPTCWQKGTNMPIITNDSLGIHCHPY